MRHPRWQCNMHQIPGPVHEPYPSINILTPVPLLSASVLILSPKHPFWCWILPIHTTNWLTHLLHDPQLALPVLILSPIHSLHHRGSVDSHKCIYLLQIQSPLLIESACVCVLALVQEAVWIWHLALWDVDDETLDVTYIYIHTYVIYVCVYDNACTNTHFFCFLCTYSCAVTAWCEVCTTWCFVVALQSCSNWMNHPCEHKHIHTCVLCFVVIVYSVFVNSVKLEIYMFIYIYIYIFIYIYIYIIHMCYQHIYTSMFVVVVYSPF